MDAFVQRIENELSRLIPRDELSRSPKYLLAVSGGMDSMAMLHSFVQLDLVISAAHFNFKLRAQDSELDQDLVTQFCQDYDIPLFVRSEDTNRYASELKLSTQVAARDLRYQFFEDLTTQHDFDYVCTAHHGNDQLETFFIHLFRGSGLKGLSGIPQIRNRIIRPMLWIPHAEILRYVQRNSIPYREDVSNQSDKYLRNRIRRHIIEPLTADNPKYLDKSLFSIAILNEYQAYMDQELQHFVSQYEKKYSNSIRRVRLSEKIRHSPKTLFLLKLYLLDQGLYPDSVQDFLKPKGRWKTGAQYEGDVVDMWYDRNQLWIIRHTFYDGWNVNERIQIPPDTAITLPGGDRVNFSTHRKPETAENVWEIPIDREKVQLPLYARHRRPGDVIELGTVPYYRKTLKKFLTEKRVPHPFKDRIYVVVDANDTIISIPGLTNSPKYTDDSSQDVAVYFSHACSYLEGL